jgi:hypothetical protein
MLDETLGAPTSRDDDRRVRGGNLPAHVWLLLIAAAIQVAVLWMSRSAVTQPLPLSSIVGIVSNVTSFVLAAAVLVGRRRWPSGKRWLVAGAAAFAVIGLFDLGRDLWFAAQPYGNLSVDVTSQTLMRVRGTIVAALAIAAPFLLGVGLWISHHERASRARVAAMLVVGIVGSVATVGGVLEVSISLGVAPQPPQPFDDPLLILTGLNAAGLAVLAGAATRNLSSCWSLPDLPIAAAPPRGLPWMDGCSGGRSRGYRPGQLSHCPKVGPPSSAGRMF